MRPRSCSPLPWMVRTYSACSSASGPNHLAVADDRRERRAQLVAHRREEVRLEAVDLFQLVERGLEAPRLLFELAVALAHRVEVQLARDPRLVTREDDELERRLEVLRDARDRLGLHARDLCEELGGLNDVEPFLRALQSRRRLLHAGGREGPQDDSTDATPFVLERHDAIRETGEARMREVAALAGIDALRPAHRLTTRDARAGELIHVAARLELGRGGSEQGAVGGVDADAEREERVDAVTQLLERLAIDDVRELDRLVADHVERGASGRVAMVGHGAPTKAPHSERAFPS
jgi:hypothetical protein